LSEARTSHQISEHLNMRIRNLLVLGAGLLVSALAGAADTSLRLGTAIVIDSSTNIAYVADATGHLEAIALSDGQALWRSEVLGMPLAVSNGLLTALHQQEGTGMGSVVMLDPATGVQQGRIELELPTGVQVNILPLPQRRFSVATTQTEMGLRLYWSYTGNQSRAASI
jgi:hypothetical protein